MKSEGPSIPEGRVRTLNESPARAEGDFVLYWMAVARRLRWNFGLQRAADEARSRKKPLVILEVLASDHRWASARFHRLILDGMAEHAEELGGGPIAHYPYVERKPGVRTELIETLADRACIVISDDYPCFELPEDQESIADRIRVRMELVDGNGLLPMRAVDRAFTSAYHFRRALQKELPEHLLEVPVEDPLGSDLPRARKDLLSEEFSRWPRASADEMRSNELLKGFPIDHAVEPVARRGGGRTAGETLSVFIEERLNRYAEDRNVPDAKATSGLSPALHLGHVSVHQILEALAERESWNPGNLSGEASGKRAGWWGFSENSEAFLDELVTWRELGFNMCAHRDDYDRYESLPDWARDTLELHQQDERPHLYSLDEFEGAKTSDPIWNAAQRELLREGKIHGYMRMLWGKKILEWTPGPREALEVMTELNNKYAIDGRDPNSYSGIFWILGRYDRPWPEREVFGKVRTMTSESTRRKFRLDSYLERFGEGS